MQMLVDDNGRFASLVDELSEADAYGLDAEFHGESSYYPRLAVLQVLHAPLDGVGYGGQVGVEVLVDRGADDDHDVLGRTDAGRVGRAGGPLPG